MNMQVAPKIFRKFTTTMYGQVPTNTFFYIISPTTRVRINVGSNNTTKQYTFEKRKASDMYDITNEYCDTKPIGQSCNLYSAIQKANVKLNNEDKNMLQAIDSNFYQL